MKFLLSIFVISISSILYGQNKVFLFEDYRLCTTGFKDVRGNVIHDAIFDKVEDIRIDLEASTIFYYKVEHDGYEGLLNEKGEVVLPWKHDDIALLPDSQYIVSLNGRYGMVDRNNDILVDFKYDFLERPGSQIYIHARMNNQYYLNAFLDQEPYYFFTLNGKKGVLDEHFKERIPAKYESIEKIPLDVYGIDFSQGYYFQVKNDKRVGALDSMGMELVPVEFSSINMIKAPNTNGEPTPYFILQDTNQTYTFRTFHGKIILPDEYDRINAAFDEDADPRIQLITSAIGKTKDTYVVYNFISQRYFRDLNNAMPFENYVLFEDDSGWGIIDDKGNIVTKGNKEIPSVFEGELQGFPNHDNGEYSYYEESFNTRRLEPEDGIIHISKPHKFKKRTDRNDITHLSIKKVGLKGAMNFRTGAKIPMKYWFVAIKKELGETYYWAVLPHNTKLESRVRIDIYDESMSFIRRITVTQPYDPEYEIYNKSRIIHSDYAESAYRKLFIVQENNLFGAYTMNGELALPFEYDLIQLEPWYSSPEELGIAFYRLAKNKKFGLLDKNLSTLLPIEWDNIQLNTQQMVLWAKKEDKNSIFNLDGSIRVDQFTEYYFQPLLLFDGSAKKGENNSDIYTYYLKKNGQLYVMENDSITLMDSSRIKFREPILTLFDLVKLNVNGQLISDLSQYRSSLPDNLGRYCVQDGLLEIVDQNWVLRLSVPEVSRITLYEGKLVTFHTDRSSTAINLKKMEIEFTTAYPAFLFPFQGTQRTISSKYWILPLEKYPQGTRDRWAICDSKGRLLDSLFEYPTVLYQDVTRKKGKCGLLDRNLHQLLPYEYDFISLVRGTYLLKKDGLWGTYNPETGILNEPKYTGISIIELTNGNRIVSKGMEIGVVDRNFQLVVPMTSSEVLSSDSLDLYQFLLGNDKSNAHFFGAFETSNLPQAYRRISNGNILRNIRNYDTHSRLMELGVTEREDLISRGRIDHKWMNWVRSSETNSIFFHKNNYYSEERKTKREQFKPKNFSHNIDEIETTEKHTVRINYKINGKSSDKLVLKELFTQPNNAHLILTDLLMEVYTENQAFGLACPNISAIVADAKDDFIIGPGGIRLFSPSAPKGSVFLSKELLIPHLLDKKMFD